MLFSLSKRLTKLQMYSGIQNSMENDDHKYVVATDFILVPLGTHISIWNHEKKLGKINC